MSTELIKYEPLPLARIEDYYSMASALMQTNFFGTKNPGDILMVLCTCQQEKMSLMKWRSTFHIVNGQPSKKAGAIQADFQKAGGIVKIEKRDSEGSVATFTMGETSYTSKCLWEEIKEEPFAKSPNYKTPRKRMQMQWARCLSDGITAVHPESLSGMYTPEETEDFTAEATVAPEVATKRAKKVQEQAQPTAPAQPTQVQAHVSAPVYTQPQQQPTAQEQADYAAEAEASRPTPVQQGQPTAQEQEPTPFTIIEDQKNPDFSLCPIQGPLYRIPWFEMPTEHLEAALTIQMPDGYITFVRNLISNRKATPQQ